MMLEYNYGAVLLVIRALEDYAKGPGFLMKDRGERILKENSAYNEQPISIREFSDARISRPYIHLDEVYEEPPYRRLERWIYRVTDNGHRFFPLRWLRREPAAIGYDWSYQPQKQSLRRYLLAVNTQKQSVALRELDKEKYRALSKRYHRILRILERDGARIRREYAKKMGTLVSERFWRKYLGL